MISIKFTFKTIFSAVLLMSAVSVSCQDDVSVIPMEDEAVAVEEESRNKSSSLCTVTGSKNVDYVSPVNHGILDDRTCRYDYEEKKIGSSNTIWGTYRITAGTVTGGSTLSPRMERKFTPRVAPKGGNYQHFKGRFRIEDVGGQRGTYIIQAKGKHEGHIDTDPALCLIIARKVVVDGDIYFDLYREQITKRDGKFSNDGRKDVKLTRVKRYENFDLEMKTGFWGNPVNSHYANVRIKGQWYYWQVPAPEEALETGIRYGAYSVSSGTARINVCNTSYTYKNN